MQPFPLVDLKAQYLTIKAEIDAAILRVMASQQFILGPEVEGLEKDRQAATGRFASVPSSVWKNLQPVIFQRPQSVSAMQCAVTAAVNRCCLTDDLGMRGA